MSKLNFSNIRLLAVDVDGVMTDGGMYYSESGDEFKKFNSKDGVGIKAVIAMGIHVGVISAGCNTNLIHRRSKLLGIDRVYAGEEPKLHVLNQWCKELSIELDSVVFVGDDLPDRDVMDAVGIAVCPADAVAAIKDISDVVLESNGGDACLRELIDTYLLPALS